jgi:uncharacterized protein YuzE
MKLTIEQIKKDFKENFNLNEEDIEFAGEFARMGLFEKGDADFDSLFSMLQMLYYDSANMIYVNIKERGYEPIDEETVNTYIKLIADLAYLYFKPADLFVDEKECYDCLFNTNFIDGVGMLSIVLGSPLFNKKDYKSLMANHYKLPNKSL